MNLSRDTLDKFWAKVKVLGRDECWEWVGSKTGSGYGDFYVNEHGKSIGAHRMSFLLHNGKLPPNGNVVRHTCDNSICVNPSHLIPGTKSDNAQDAIERGLFKQPDRSGDNNGAAKLTSEKVADICAFLDCGTSIRWIARKYGVTYSTIWMIKKGKTWTDVPRKQTGHTKF